MQEQNAWALLGVVCTSGLWHQGCASHHGRTYEVAHAGCVVEFCVLSVPRACVRVVVAASCFVAEVAEVLLFDGRGELLEQMLGAVMGCPDCQVTVDTKCSIQAVAGRRHT
jgi:hypothetical protein